MKLKEIRVDGYKNLIDCKVPLGDFNVLVGPNNSGKSNLLEIFVILKMSLFGDDELREILFQGYPARLVGSSICHLDEYINKPIVIGFTFECIIGKKIWRMEYDLTIRCNKESSEQIGFIEESLIAKDSSKTGVAKTYFLRKEKILTFLGKSHSISKKKSTLDFIDTTYPEYNELPSELIRFISAIIQIVRTPIFSLSPESLRKDIDKGKEIKGWRISTYDLLVAIEKIEKEKKKFNLFKTAVCNILDFEDIDFNVQEIPLSSKKKINEDTLKRVRTCYIKRIGSGYAPIEEFSDGTLIVVSILAALFIKERYGLLFCIDELENSLHPEAVEKLLRFMQEHADRWPVLLTTHSPYIVNGVKPADVIVAVVDETGAAHFEKIKDRKALNNYLKSGYMSFGDLMATNFEEVLGGD